MATAPSVKVPEPPIEISVVELVVKVPAVRVIAPFSVKDLPEISKVPLVKVKAAPILKLEAFKAREVRAPFKVKPPERAVRPLGKVFETPLFSTKREVALSLSVPFKVKEPVRVKVCEA